MADEIKELREENDKLRYLLASGSDPCVYCGLAKADMSKCASGFPGCGRADDLMSGWIVNAPEGQEGIDRVLDPPPSTNG